MRKAHVAANRGGTTTITANVSCQLTTPSTISTPPKVKKLTTAWIRPVWRSELRASTSVVIRVITRPPSSRS